MIPIILQQVANALSVDLENGASRIQVLRVTTDSRDVRPGDLFIAIRGERFDGHEFVANSMERGAVGCVVDRQWHAESDGRAAYPCVVVPDTIRALGELGAWYRREVMNQRTVVIAVTGSNGKTTAKRMIDHVLEESVVGRASPKSFNNHIGVPLTLLSAEKSDRYLVVEIGTSALGEVAALAQITSPDVGIITSVGEAHLQGLGSLENIAVEKASLFDHVRPGGMAIANVDCAELRALLEERESFKLFAVGFDQAANFRVRCIRRSMRHSTIEMDGRFVVDLPMPGAHHATNAAAAFAVARWFGLDPEVIIDRLATFESPSGRTCTFEKQGVTIVDDTYNANPSSMRTAIETLRVSATGRRVFVMGDMLELGEASEDLHRQIVREVVKAEIELLVVIGKASASAVELEWAAQHNQPQKPKLVVCADAEDGSRVIPSMLMPGDSVWLKGSRAMNLDRVVKALCERSGNKAAVA